MAVEEALHDLDRCDALLESPIAGDNEVDIIVAIRERFLYCSCQSFVQQRQTFSEPDVMHYLFLHTWI